jgi:lysophospholipase L1-like esterase
MVLKSIVALGNSLTTGYYSAQGFGYPFYTPYTDILQDRLSENGKKVIVINKGINGDTSSGMIERFHRSVASEKPNYVIIWAGINDLFRGISPEEVLANLKTLYSLIFDIPSVPIACGLTPVRGSPHLNEVIRELNRGIQNKCRKKKIIYIDLYDSTADPYGRLLSEYSNDGVHLSIGGYKKVAETIYSYINDLF